MLALPLSHSLFLVAMQRKMHCHMHCMPTPSVLAGEWLLLLTKSQEDGQLLWIRHKALSNDALLGFPCGSHSLHQHRRLYLLVGA